MKIIKTTLVGIVITITGCGGEADWQERLAEYPENMFADMYMNNDGAEQVFVEGRMELVVGAPDAKGMEQFLYLIDDGQAYRATLRFLSSTVDFDQMPSGGNTFSPVGAKIVLRLGDIYRVRGISLEVQQIFDSGGEYEDLPTRALIVDVLEYVGTPE